MNYSIEVTGKFKRQLKRLVKKYPSLKSEFKKFIETLEKNPIQGTDLGNNCYKMRLAIASKGKGKSGGARIISHVLVVDKKVYLIAIYDKSEQETISDKEIKEILKSL
jgi:mRNA-degrading endonuclease RelE of RelBE toxin-antitoxin system